jgi:hypothetical protein
MHILDTVQYKMLTMYEHSYKYMYIMFSTGKYSYYVL